MNSTTLSNADDLSLFGRDFEQHGGLRALAVADGMHETDPVVDTDYHLDTLSTRFGDEEAVVGTKRGRT